MLHANAALTPRQRLRLARLVVEEGWPVVRAAEFFGVSWPTAARWAARYRSEGPRLDDRPVKPPPNQPGQGWAGGHPAAHGAATAQALGTGPAGGRDPG